MPRPLKPIRQRWYTPPDTPASRLALTGKADPEDAAKAEEANAAAVAVFVATGIF